MALHPKLELYQDRRGIKRLSSLVDALAADLAPLGCAELSLDLLERDATRSFLHGFLVFQKGIVVERILRARTRVMDREVCVLIPMHDAQIWPYTAEITLHVPAPGFAA